MHLVYFDFGNVLILEMYRKIDSKAEKVHTILNKVHFILNSVLLLVAYMAILNIQLLCLEALAFYSQSRPLFTISATL